MDYEHSYYLNSLCGDGIYLHDYQIVKTYDHGVIERCSKCKDRKYFSNKGSSRRYLSYHIKSALQPHQHYFNRSYPNFIK